ncbi:hypothetical protein CVD28_03885 [Bacillus sp. M6-12]|uniref:hypothetical protein n=1 Tax=Bacillus sp. M6-12 TaxID=2054166 RepID=UPI000C78DA93|nr:hypothetical protein [Bacillus sp. M6-12]PLS19568.1 hypothetical protein CVD28_03885 [Bacillus sp. M6-12]
MAEALLQDITQTTGLFYYMTMKDFERAEERKGKKKSKKLNSEEKKALHEQLKDNLSDIFSFSSLKKSIAPKSLKINNYEDLYTFFSNADMFAFIRTAETIDTYFPCSIMEGNYAWISKTEVGHYRYFSKSKNANAIGFDLIDLLEVYYGYSTSETIEKAVKDLKIKFMEDIWVENQNKKYLSNLTMIHGAKKMIEQEYPHLFQYLKGHLKVLETMNVIANINVKKQEFGYNGENIFFASNSYIADFLGNYTLSTTNKVINLFAVLGLIKKIKEEYIPVQLLHESKVIADRRNLGNIISYYIIPPMIDTLAEAEKKAEVLIENHISYTNISRAKISFIFGEDFAKNVYVQEIQKNKIKKAEVPNLIHKILEKNLLELLSKQGYATKKMVAKKYIGKTTVKDREKELEKIWKSLLIKNELHYMKPTKEMKEEYGLKTSEYISLKK